MKKALLFNLLVAACLIGHAQMVSQYWSFDWASTTSAYSSSTVLTGTCYGGDLTVTLTTDLPHQMNDNGSGSPISYAHPPTSVLIPHPTMVTPLNFRTTITFSTPIINPGILIRDLDDDSYMAGPEEHLLDFEVNGAPGFPTSVTPTFGSYTTSGGVVTPLSEGCIGWFRFGGPVSSISFLYTRPIVNYAFLLDSLVFDCRCQNRSLTAVANGTVDAVEDLMEINDTRCQEGKFELINLSGGVVYRQNVSRLDEPLHFPEMSAGIYLARFSCGSDVTVKKILLSH